jgi:Zn-dependent oligopeptidase
LGLQVRRVCAWVYRPSRSPCRVRYYDRVYVEKTLSLDESVVKEYFPVSVVVPTILNIYQDLLGVKFVEIKDDAKDVWHPGE